MFTYSIKLLRSTVRIKKIFCLLPPLLTLSPVSAQLSSGDPTPVSGNVHEVIKLSADDNKVISAVLMYPESGINQYSPAIVFHHGGFGGHPTRQIGAPRFAGERLAKAGYTVLSLLSRQSNGHVNVRFEDSEKDLKAAVDFMASRGMKNIVLAGHSMGSIRLSNYQAATKDPRVKAIVHFAPTADMPDYILGRWGKKLYDEKVLDARKAVARGRGFLDISDDPEQLLGDEPDLLIDFTYTFQSAEPFLSWWGPKARTRNTERFPEIEVPQLLLAGTEDAAVPAGRLKQLKRAAKNPKQVTYKWYKGGDHFFSGLQEQSSNDTIDWLEQQGLGVKTPITTRMVDAKLVNGRFYPGVMYSPQADMDKNKPIFLVQHGYTGTILESSNHWLSVRLAQAGYTALAPMTRASGLTGMTSYKLQHITEDLDAWVDFLESEGYNNVITVGHSLGGILTALFVARSQDERVKGMVFLAPTRDLPSFAESSLGTERYQQIMQKAKALDAQGKGDTLMNEKYYRRPPATPGDRSVFFQQADTWINFWSPESIGVFTQRISEINKPMLSVAGADDLYVDYKYMQEVKNRAGGPMSLIWYDGDNPANHSFTGHEDLVAEAVIQWAADQEF